MEVQEKEYCSFYAEIDMTMRNKEEEVVIGNISALKILFSYPSQDAFTDLEYNRMCEFVLNKKDSPLVSIQKAVIDALPVLAKFKRQCFSENFFC